MKNHKRKTDKYQVQVELTTAAPQQTQYAGLLAVQRVWERLDVAALLETAQICYAGSVTAAAEMSFMLAVQPWVAADSQRKVAQRFGGEPSPDNIEQDPFSTYLLAGSYSQRTLNRFVNTSRYDWQAFNYARVLRLHDHPDFVPHRQGVLILDDFPLPKPYAREMAYLSPIWDNNLKRTVKGYSVVHLYYYHPRRPSYSVSVMPWLKTSATGATRRKSGRRPAQPDEEHSRLDLALLTLKTWWPIFDTCKAVLFDCWYSARWLCWQFTQLGIPWIGEAKTSQKFRVHSRFLSVNYIYELYRHKLQHVKVRGLSKQVRAVAIPAVLEPDPYTRRRQPVLLVLVEGLTKKRDNDKGYKLLVTPQRHWSIQRILRLFSYRFKIEPTHRDGKQDAGWNDFHTRTLAALHCHLNIALLRSTLLTLLSKWIPTWATYSTREMIAHGIGLLALLIYDPHQQCLVLQMFPSPLALGLRPTARAPCDSSFAC